jgi:hypothetical protein
VFSRRALFSAGAGAVIAGLGAVTAHRAGVLDDGLRGIGIKPHPEPDPGDVRLLATAAEEAESMLNLVDAALADGTVRDDERRLLVAARAVITEQGSAVGMRARTTLTEPSTDASAAGLAAVVASAADHRARDSVRAVSSEVAQVLASMAGGLDQLLVAWKRSA